MDPKQNEKKIGFFKRVKIAIFNLEEYGMFLAESFWKALKFFAILVLLIVICKVFAYNYSLSNKVLSYIENEMPEVSFENGVLKSEKNVEAYDETYNFRVFINTDETVSEEKLKEYEANINLLEVAMIFLKDKAYVCTYAVKENVNVMDSSIPEKDLYELAKQELEYKVISEAYPDVKFAGKSEFSKIVKEDVLPAMAATSFVPMTIAMFVGDFIQLFGDVCVVGIIGYIAAMFLGVKFKVSPILSLSIYSLTLSFVLKGIYSVVNVATGLVVEYFDVVYLVIGYIYIVAAIFMIKYDLIKQREELQKILEVQEKVKKELEEKEKTEEVIENSEEDNKEEKDEKEDKEEVVSDAEDNNNEHEDKEPDGSEI